MRHRILATLLAASAAAASGCIGFERESSTTAPSAAGSGALLGQWSSSNLIPAPSSCTNFVWSVTEQTPTSAKGNFSATCASELGNLQVAGSAQGAFTNESTIAWSGTANATGPGLSSCAVSLNGTAELLLDSIRIPYSGETCLGKVSGIETLKRR